MKWPTRREWESAAFYAVSQFISFFLIVANGRAYVLGLYGWTAATDGIIAIQGWVVWKRFIKDSEAKVLTIPVMAADVLGAIAGSLASIWVTKHIFGA